MFFLPSYNIGLLNNKANHRVHGKLMNHFKEWEGERKLAQADKSFDTWQEKKMNIRSTLKKVATKHAI